MLTMPIGEKLFLIVYCLLASRDRAHERDGVLVRIGMRQAAGIFRNAPIIGEMRNCFYVRERRPAQAQPLGLEDASSRLAPCRGWDILQHVRLL
jgi:hypothetical protein